MGSSSRKKRLYLTAGVMMVLILALLWHAGQYMQGSRAPRKETRRAEAKTQAMQPQPVVVTKKIPASVPGEAYAAGGNPSAVVRKKLPEMPPPAPKPESQPAVATPPPKTASPEDGPPPQSPAVEPMREAAAAPPAPEAPKVMPEKPVVARPPEPSLPPAVAESPGPPATPAVAAAPAPSPKPGPAKAIAKATPGLRGAYPFSLLLSSNRAKQNALSTLPDYRRKGLAPYLVYTDLGEKGKWWRTLYGYYSSLEDAVRAKNDMDLVEAAVVKTPFCNLIGEFPSEKEAAEVVVQLSRKGLFPYIVKGPQSSTRLMAGAFPTQQAAEQQQRELEEQGITARTIRR